MSDLTFNKIAGAVLATGLAIVGLGELSNIVFKHEEPAKAGYKIEGVEEASAGGETAVADTPPDWAAVLTPANVEAGKAVAQKCVSCHSFDANGPVIQGPSLYGVVGRDPGTHPGMAYSEAMKAFGGANKVWDYDHLYAFLKSPQKDVPGTKMTFVGIKSPEDRAAVIAYLHSLGSTLPIPPPRPAAAAVAAGPAAPATGGVPGPAATASPGAAAQGQAAPGTGAPTTNTQGAGATAAPAPPAKK
jgi:cytochrome c